MPPHAHAHATTALANGIGGVGGHHHAHAHGISGVLIDVRPPRCNACNVRPPSEYVAMSCGHAFCVPCAEKHVTSSGRCFVCKKPLHQDDVHPVEMNDDLTFPYTGGWRVRKSLVSALVNCDFWDGQHAMEIEVYRQRLHQAQKLEAAKHDLEKALAAKDREVRDKANEVDRLAVMIDDFKRNEQQYKEKYTELKDRYQKIADLYNHKCAEARASQSHSMPRLMSPHTSSRASSHSGRDESPPRIQAPSPERHQPALAAASRTPPHHRLPAHLPSPAPSDRVDSPARHDSDNYRHRLSEQDVSYQQKQQHQQQQQKQMQAMRTDDGARAMQDGRRSSRAALPQAPSFNAPPVTSRHFPAQQQHQPTSSRPLAFAPSNPPRARMPPPIAPSPYGRVDPAPARSLQQRPSATTSGSRGFAPPAASRLMPQPSTFKPIANAYAPQRHTAHVGRTSAPAAGGRSAYAYAHAPTAYTPKVVPQRTR